MELPLTLGYITNIAYENIIEIYTVEKNPKWPPDIKIYGDASSAEFIFMGNLE